MSAGNRVYRKRLLVGLYGTCSLTGPGCPRGWGSAGGDGSVATRRSTYPNTRPARWPSAGNKQLTPGVVPALSSPHAAALGLLPPYSLAR